MKCGVKNAFALTKLDNKCMLYMLLQSRHQDVGGFQFRSNIFVTCNFMILLNASLMQKINHCKVREIIPVLPAIAKIVMLLQNKVAI